MGYAAITVYDDTESKTAHDKARGRSQVDRTYNFQNADGTSLTLTRSNSGQLVVDIDMSSSLDAETADSLGTRINVWANLGVCGSLLVYIIHPVTASCNFVTKAACSGEASPC